MVHGEDGGESEQPAGQRHRGNGELQEHKSEINELWKKFAEKVEEQALENTKWRTEKEKL